jgi:hypothetical protein
VSAPTVTLVCLDIGHSQTIQRPFDDGGDLFGRIVRWVLLLLVGPVGRLSTPSRIIRAAWRRREPLG